MNLRCNQNMVFSRTFAIMMIVLGLTACQQRNSFSEDSALYGSTGASGSAAFIAANAVLRTECATCHEHTQFSSYSETDYINNQYVVAGSSSASSLFLHIKGNGDGGAQDMPQDGTLTNTQVQAIKTWIDGITPSS